MYDENPHDREEERMRGKKTRNSNTHTNAQTAPLKANETRQTIHLTLNLITFHWLPDSLQSEHTTFRIQHVCTPDKTVQLVINFKSFAVK